MGRMHVFLMVLAMAFLPACATQPAAGTDPFVLDWNHQKPERVRLNQQKEKSEKKAAKIQMDLLSYLGRNMLNVENRKQQLNRLQNAYVAKDFFVEGATDYAFFKSRFDQTGMDIAAFNAAIGLAINLTNPGAMDKVSGIALPEEIDGEKIANKERAWQLAIQHSEAQLLRIAKHYDLTLVCQYGCGKPQERRIYLLKPNAPDTFKGYTYQPKGPIVVQATWSPVEYIEEPDTLESALRNYIPRWATPQGNMWLTNFFTEPTLDAQGKVMTKVNEAGLVYPVVEKNLAVTRLGRDFLRLYTQDGGYLHYGNQKIWPGYLAHNGELYSFISKNDKRFIEYKLVEKETSE